MSMMEDILENQMIERIAKNFLKAPHKINEIHETDAELIKVGNGYDHYLAITTDVLVEEIASGLYDDPYLIGWMLAVVNFSDLAAVGADLLGLLISVNHPPDISEKFIEKLTEGISAACRQLNTFVLGGDTNQAKELFLSGCAVGLVPQKSTITRIGAKPGDRLYLTAPAGLGSIFAFLQIAGQNSQLPGSFYRPIARIGEGKIIREFANCCMDTSDGVIHTVDTLMRLNRCQFVLDDDWEQVLHPMVLQVSKAQHLPPWLALAGVHGEFELCFTISCDKEESFLQEAAKMDWKPLPIGEITAGTGVSIRTGKRLVPVDSTSIRNLSELAGSEPKAYIRKLLEIGHNIDI
ncbi:MAG: thiamine-monophosphate kinase [Candidatus Aminicenantes bacterium]|nr:thiamine-monophosphate kinase [Candidatus Aminicenantes bacterium]